MGLSHVLTLWCVVWLVVAPFIGEALNKVRISMLCWLTSGDDILRNDDITSSIMVIPIAMHHFNTRRADLVPALGNLGSCNLSLEVAHGRIEDTEGKPTAAMTLFFRDYQAKSVDLVYAIRSEVVAPLGVAVGALGIPLVSHVATTDSLSNKVIYPTVFRTVSSDAYRADLVCKLFERARYRVVGVLHSRDVFGLGLRASVQTSCLSRGVRIIAAGFDSALVGEDYEKGVRSAMQSLVNEGLRVIYFTSTVEDRFLYTLAKVADELEWLEDRLYIGNKAPLQSTVNQAPNRHQLMRFLNGLLVITGSINASNTIYRAVADEWPKFDEGITNSYLPNTTAPSGASFQLEQGYFNKLAPKLSQLRLWPLAYDTTIAIGLAACSKSPSESLVSSLSRVEFEGTSGNVFFNENLDRPNEYHELQNCITNMGQLVVKTVGFAAANGNWTIRQGEIIFSDGTNEWPLDLEPPPHVVDRLPLGAIIWGGIECALVTAASLSTLIYLLRHWRDKAFVESQPVFMLLIVIGCVFMSLSIVGLVVESDVGCMWFPVFFVFGFALMLSSLIAKSARVALLWYSREPMRNRKNKNKGSFYLKGVAVSMLIISILLATWIAVAPLTFATRTSKRDNHGFPLYSSAMCHLTRTANIFLALVITYICLLVFGAMFCAYWVRNAPEKFHEARLTAVAGMALFQVFFVGIPTAVAVWTMALPRFFVLSSLTAILCLITLGTMFLPKIFRNFFGVEQSSQTPLHQTNVTVEPGHGANQRASPSCLPATIRKRKAASNENPAAPLNNEPHPVRIVSDVERVLESVEQSANLPRSSRHVMTGDDEDDVYSYHATSQVAPT